MADANGKKKAGRPPAENPYSRSIQIRLTQQQYDVLWRRALAGQQNVSVYVREVLFPPKKGKKSGTDAPQT